MKTRRQAKKKIYIRICKSVKCMKTRICIFELEDKTNKSLV